MTMRLSDIVARVDGARLIGDDCAVTDVVHRHDDAGAGHIFAAVAGAKHDGHDFAAEAVNRGALAVLASRQTSAAVPHILVHSVRDVLGAVASLVHGEPSRALDVFGVTGTNGKTTVAAFIEAACAANGVGTGVIGTVATRILGASQPGVRTTPEATDLQRLLHTMYARGVDTVAMEVSSHGLDLRRVDGTRFASVLFTNLSQDHLDYHGSMTAYFAAKQRLFTPAFADHGFVFLADQWAQKLVNDAPIPVTTIGYDLPCDVRVIVKGPYDGLLTGYVEAIGAINQPIRVAIPGRHNLANAALAAVAVATHGVPLATAVAGIAHAPGVPGRLEPVLLGDGVRAYVDFAHTPDAITAVIGAARELTGAHGRVLVVVGCGGERDQAKRGPMGAAATGADIAILTSDNPRSEDPNDILAAVYDGAKAAVRDGAKCDVLIDVERRAAIFRAVEIAAANDVIIVAGKGHETTQTFADHSVPFDDRQVLLDAYRAQKGQ